MFRLGNFDNSSLFLIYIAGLFAYNGWNYLNFIIEELKDPVKNLPRAIAISLILVTLVYLFTNIGKVMIRLISKDQLTEIFFQLSTRSFHLWKSWEVKRLLSLSLTERLECLLSQFQVILLIFFSLEFKKLNTLLLFSVFVALSTFGAVNGILLTSSRLFYAGACEGQMPEILTMIQIQRLTPTPAVLAISLVRRKSSHLEKLLLIYYS